MRREGSAYRRRLPPTLFLEPLRPLHRAYRVGLHGDILEVIEMIG